MTNRSRTEIVRQIMETVKDYDVEGEGITQTKLMYKVYLSSAQSKEYLALLTAHHLLIYNPANRRYSITEKGLRYLGVYYKLSHMMSEEEEVEEIDYAELPRM
jgi:predicted transcriptional regulator